MHILFVEDNPDFSAEICFQLETLGHQVIPLDCGKALLERLQTHELPDVVLLDLGLPDIDGLDLAEELRTHHPELLLVILTARNELEERVSGWSVGADAYLTKPVHLRELSAVLDSLFQRRGPRESAAWTLALPAQRLIGPQGQTCQLTYVERTLLQTLARRPGEPVERHELVLALGKELWDYDMRRLEAAMSRLRKKIVDLGGGKELIRPVRGTGYLFAGCLQISDQE